LSCGWRRGCLLLAPDFDTILAVILLAGHLLVAGASTLSAGASILSAGQPRGARAGIAHTTATMDTVQAVGTIRKPSGWRIDFKRIRACQENHRMCECSPGITRPRLVNSASRRALSATWIGLWA
jgi:hypothetical protein